MREFAHALVHAAKRLQRLAQLGKGIAAFIPSLPTDIAVVTQTLQQRHDRKIVHFALVEGFNGRGLAPAQRAAA